MDACINNWNEIVFSLNDCKTHNVMEREYQDRIEGCFRILGWRKYKGEIRAQENIRIGAANSIFPDLILSNDQGSFVVEIKQPNNSLSETQKQQLFSYMRQLKLYYGLYIGGNISLFYDWPENREDPVCVFTVEIKNDDENGIRFVKLFGREAYSDERLRQFCESRLEEAKGKERIEAEINRLCSDEGETLLKSLLAEKMRTDNKSPKWIEDILSVISIEVRRKGEKQEAPTPQTVANVIERVRQFKSNDFSHSGAYSRFSVEDGPFTRVGKLAYNVIRVYMERNPNARYVSIKSLFGNLVIDEEEYGRKKNLSGDPGFERRYGNEMLTSCDGITFRVSNQLGKGTPYFNLTRSIAESLGYKIEEK